MGVGVDGVNVPSKKLEHWNMSVEFYVDLPPDRDHSVRRSSLAEQSGAGINVFIGSDQVRFYRDLREIPVDDVPAIVYSEVMRDVDLFTTVAAVGDDATWSDQGDRGTGVFSERFDINDFSATTALRAEMLSRVLPRDAHRGPLHDRQSVARGARATRHVSHSIGMGRRDVSYREHHALAEDSPERAGRGAARSQHDSDRSSIHVRR